MIICVWCSGIVAGGQRAVAQNTICERCLPPVEHQIAAAVLRLEVQRAETAADVPRPLTSVA